MYTISLKCPNCGASVQGDSTMCGYCGASIQLIPELQQVKLLGFACPRCGTLADKTARFCSNCGETLLVKCPECRRDMPLSAHVCPSCGLNRVARSLIREADEKRKVVERLADDRLEKVREQVAQNAVFQQVRERLSREAKILQAEGEQIANMASRLSSHAGSILVAAIAAPLVFCGLVQLVVGANGDANAWAISCLGGIPVFLVVAGVSAAQFAKSREARRRADEIKTRAEEMQLPDAWRKYATPEESSAIQAVLEWGEQQEALILQQKESDLALVDRWLEECFRNLK